MVARVREWNGKTEVEWPERAAGLLQAQPLSEPRARQEPRQLKSRANIISGYVPVHCAPVVNGAVECFEKFILTRPSTRK